MPMPKPSDSCHAATQPARERPARTGPARPVAVPQRPAVAAGEHGQRQRDATGGEHLQVAGLGEPPRRVRERRPRHGRADPARAELADERVRPDEGEREHQHVHDVVAEQGGHRAGADHAGRHVAEQGVGEGEAVALGVERVGLPQARRVGERGHGPDQAICQACMVGSPVSMGIVVVGWRSVGQVITAASRSAPRPTSVGSWRSARRTRAAGRRPGPVGGVGRDERTSRTATSSTATAKPCHGPVPRAVPWAFPFRHDPVTSGRHRSAGASGPELAARSPPAVAGAGVALADELQPRPRAVGASGLRLAAAGAATASARRTPGPA